MKRELKKSHPQEVTVQAVRVRFSVDGERGGHVQGSWREEARSPKVHTAGNAPQKAKKELTGLREARRLGRRGPREAALQGELPLASGVAVEERKWERP